MLARERDEKKKRKNITIAGTQAPRLFKTLGYQARVKKAVADSRRPLRFSHPTHLK